MRAYNVLVIDDDPSIRELLQKLLSDRTRFRTLIAGNGPEALRCLTEERVDVVLSDIHMPGFTGLELLKDMQRVNIRPEIVIMTANATPENVESARALGARSMLIKPFDDLAVVEEEIEKAVRDVEARGDAPAQPPIRPVLPGPPAFSNRVPAPGPRPSVPVSAPAPAPAPESAPAPAARPAAPDKVESIPISGAAEAVEIDTDPTPSAWTELTPPGDEREMPPSPSVPVAAAGDDLFPVADDDSLAAADSITVVDEETPAEDEPVAAADDGVPGEVSFRMVDETPPPALPDFDAWKSARPAVPATVAPPPRPPTAPAPPVRDLLMLPIEIAPERSGRPGAAFDEPEEAGPAAPVPGWEPEPSPIDVAAVEEMPEEPEPSSTSWQEPPPEVKEWAEPAPGSAGWAEPVPPAPAGTADIPEELAEILRMDEILDLERLKIQVPIICLQTWEEETAVASLRAVCASLKREFHCWSAASGIVRDGGVPMGDAYRDPTRALEFIRRQKGRALFVLADFRHYLEDPAVVRVLREMVMARETVLAMLVLTAPRLTIPPELARVTALFEWPAYDGDSLRAMFEEIRKEVEASSGRRIAIGPKESEALLGVMRDMPAARARFEITRALMALMNRAS